MNILCSMSLGGSIFFFIYLLIKPIANRHFKAQWQYTFLKIVMIFYLFPYQILKLQYTQLIHSIMLKSEYLNPSYTNYKLVYLDKVIIIDENGLPYFINRTLFLILGAAWLLLVSIIVIKHVVQYFKCKQKLEMISNTATNQLSIILVHCKQDISMSKRKQINLLQNQNISSPFTIGILKPCIILPDIALNNEKMRMFLTHELVHIKNNDILFKFLSFFIILLHWFKPLVYVLFIELCNISERVCDETVTANMKENEKKDYGNLIIEMALKSTNVSILFADSFSRSKNMIKVRIKCMNNKIIAPRYMKVVTIIVTVITLLVSPLSVLAYEPLTISDGFSEGDLMNTDMVYFLQTDTSEVFTNLDNYYECGHDIFVDLDGNIYDISQQDSFAIMAICTHSLINGQLQFHTTNGSGCTITIYSGKRCTKCSYYYKGDLISTHTFATCTH